MDHGSKTASRVIYSYTQYATKYFRINIVISLMLHSRTSSNLPLSRSHTQASSQDHFIIVTDSLAASSAMAHLYSSHSLLYSKSSRFSHLTSPHPYEIILLLSAWTYTNSRQRKSWPCCQTGVSPSQNQPKSTSNKIWPCSFHFNPFTKLWSQSGKTFTQSMN